MQKSPSSCIISDIILHIQCITLQNNTVLKQHYEKTQKLKKSVYKPVLIDNPLKVATDGSVMEFDNNVTSNTPLISTPENICDAC